MRGIATLTGRELAHWFRQPAPILITWAFPLLIALMFGGLFGGAMAVPDGRSYFDFLMPGMLALTLFFGLESTMLAVAADANKGITDRFRSMPLSGVAILGGRSLAEILSSLVGLVLMAAAGLALGWRWEGGPADVLTAFVLLIWFRMGLLWVGLSLGLAARNPDLVMAIQILIWPASFLSSVFVDPSTMPPWLGVVAEANPLSAVATATR